jgi:hypothetical protein
VCGLLSGDWVKFFLLGSVSRGIPSREWEFPLKDIKACASTFFPPANIIAVTEEDHERE